MKQRLIRKFYLHMCKHYHTYSFIANGLIAVSMAGLAFLGVLTHAMTVTAMVCWGGLFALIFALGKWLDQEVEDMDKVTNHEEVACDIKSAGKDNE